MIELIEGLMELWCSWRWYACIAVGAGIAFLLHHILPQEPWIWFISAPAIVAAVIIGWRWQVAADRDDA